MSYKFDIPRSITKVIVETQNKIIMEKFEKLYKVIDSNGKSFNGGEFDWNEYLPELGKPGKWTPVIKDILECIRGYHVTPYWNMWFQQGCKVFEVETQGLLPIENPGVGVINKFVCSSVRLVKFVDINLNTGILNTGYQNAGNQNTGNLNTGNRNTGNLNTGDQNTGDRNTGDRNTGDQNTGYQNTGYQNTGDRNTGYRNTGDRNTGYRNTGDWNAGNQNTGDWNAGNQNTGSFNSGTPQYYELFNKPISAEKYNSIIWPEWFFFELKGTYLNAWNESFNQASIKEINQTGSLPDFEYTAFE